jgi:hypothetical protein
VAAPDGDPDHAIMSAPYSWELVEFTYRRNRADWRESFIDLVLVRDGVVRRLRFFAPQEIELTRGVPNSSGLYIRDVSGRKLEGVGVRVGSFEPDYCVPHFCASHVVEVVEPRSGEPCAEPCPGRG